MPLTPKLPRDSILPNPVGKFTVGGFKLHDTVARVRMSDARSVRECHASAIMDCELNR